jgi:hypothetical protein
MRVLRPGGRFLFADIFLEDSGEGADLTEARLVEAGLEIESRADITENVRAAREAVSRSPAFLEYVRQSMPPYQVPSAEQVLALEGTPWYEKMESGKALYVHWRLLKPAE